MQQKVAKLSGLNICRALNTIAGRAKTVQKETNVSSRFSQFHAHQTQVRETQSLHLSLFPLFLYLYKKYICIYILFRELIV